MRTSEALDGPYQQLMRQLTTISERPSEPLSLGEELLRQESPLSVFSADGKPRGEFEDCFALTTDFLGFGSTAVVRVAVNRETREKVAVKMINAKKGRSDKNDNSHWQQLCQEVMILSSLDHPGIVQVSEFFVSSETSFLVMEHLAGGSVLHHIQEAERLSELQAALVAEQLLEALECLHSLGIAHCDVTPSNLVYASAKRSQVKLVDFGSCLRWMTGERPLEQGRGTLSYMAPEAVRANCYTDKADLWSSGATVHAMLTGRTVYQTFHGKAIFHETFDECPKTARRFVDALLTADPSARPSAADALRHAWMQEIPAMLLQVAETPEDPDRNTLMPDRIEADVKKKPGAGSSSSDASTFWMGSNSSENRPLRNDTMVSFVTRFSGASNYDNDETDAILGLPMEAAVSGVDSDRQSTADLFVPTKADEAMDSGLDGDFVRTSSTMATLGTVSDAMSTLSSLDENSIMEAEEGFGSQQYQSAPAWLCEPPREFATLLSETGELSPVYETSTSKEFSGSLCGTPTYQSAPTVCLPAEEPPTARRQASGPRRLASFLWRTIRPKKASTTKRVAPEMAIVPSPNMRHGATLA